MATTTPPGLLPDHWAELQASAIAPDVAALNFASWGPGTSRHWESERGELTHYGRRKIQTESTAGSGLPQAQPGHLAGALIRLDSRYRHLAAGGWRTLSAELEGVPRFDQWKPDQPRQRGKRNERTGEWVPEFDEQGRPVPQKYEAPQHFPGGGGLFLPQVPERCWQLICNRHGLPLPDPATIAAGFWAWALKTPKLEILATEGSKKAAAAISAGYAALGLPGVTMGFRGSAENGRRLIPALRALSARHHAKRCRFVGQGRRWRIAFDAEAKPSTAARVAAAAGALAQTLRAVGGRVEIARLPLLSGARKTGLDDLLAAQGAEALAQALDNTGPAAVLPDLTRTDRAILHGGYIGQSGPLPTPADAPLVVIRAPMGSGKTEAVAQALAPLAADGVAVLMPSHRLALGRAASERVGVPWCPAVGSDQRLQGVAACWDSWRPSSPLAISPTGWTGGVMVPDELMQSLEYLLLSTGTTLAKVRPEVMRTVAEQLPRLLQLIALDAQLADWGVRLLERLSGRRAYVIRSDFQPMRGRHLHAPQKLKTPAATSKAFRAKWAELLEAEGDLFCWSSAQQGHYANSASCLAAINRQRRPADVVELIDSTTPELAAELAADPDGYTARRSAEAREQGGHYRLYTTSAISSGLSFQRWRPAAVIAYSGGRIAPEHVAQALARVRCPEVPAYVFAPLRCPGGALRVGSEATDPAQLIADLRAVADTLYGQLQDAGDPWLEAWGELGAIRNRQRFAYAATIAGLLQAEGWELQAPGPEPCPVAAAQVAAELKAIAADTLAAEDAAVIDAPVLEPQAAADLAGRPRRQLDPDEQAALDRFALAERWALGQAAPSPQLLEADREGLRDRLQLGWLLRTPQALELVPDRDWQAIAALDPEGQPFAPDRLRVTIGSRLAALAGLGVPQLLERFQRGDVIASTDPALAALHATATAHRGQLIAAANVSPGKLPSGTLRALLEACGWQLQKAGRIKARGDGRDAYTYTATPVALPQGVELEALAATWLAELQEETRPAEGTGAFFTKNKNRTWQKKPHATPQRPATPSPPLAASPCASDSLGIGAPAPSIRCSRLCRLSSPLPIAL